MSEEKCFHLSRGGSCNLPSCNHQRVELQVVDWTGCGGEAREESFDVTTWTPQQFAALRVFVNAGAGSSSAFAEELKRISDRPVRMFHLLHSILGPEGIKRIYAKFTIQKYRRLLRNAGFDYPSLPVPTGSRPPKVIKDLSKGPSKPRRSLKSGGSPVPGSAGMEGAPAKGALRP
jgi:hypothetical protein